MEINGEIVSENVRYADLGLSEPIMKALEKKGYEQATPVQGGAIPYFMEYKDVIAKAPTGTGKTFAFGIPMVEHIDPACEDVQGLVLAPKMCIRDRSKVSWSMMASWVFSKLVHSLSSTEWLFLSLKCLRVLKLIVWPRYSRFFRMFTMVDDPQP